MLRRRWVVFLPIVPTVVSVFAVPVSSGELNFSLGLKGQYAELTRTLKIDGRRTEAPTTDAAWLEGVVFNAVYGRLFLGAGYARSTFNDRVPSASGGSRFVDGGNVDVSEMDLAIGYSIAPWASPYIGYLRHRQRSGQDCGGCIGRVEFRDAGAGLLVHYPLPNPRSAVYVNAAFIRGFFLEGGLSYAGVRWPLVGAVGYAYRRIDYPSGEASCSLPGLICFHERDVFAGPTVAVHYVF